MISNCIIETVKAGRADGWRGKSVIHPSRCGRFFHMHYERFDGAIVNFVPPMGAVRLPFPPPLFRGEIINHDDEWRCHNQLIEWGMSVKEVRGMTGNQVIAAVAAVENSKHKEDY